MEDVFSWIVNTLNPEFCTPDKFIYEDMDSQSGCSLPFICYSPFDPGQKSHWRDRGGLFDFLCRKKIGCSCYNCERFHLEGKQNDALGAN
jgi:hypothetical protein